MGLHDQALNITPLALKSRGPSRRSLGRLSRASLHMYSTGVADVDGPFQESLFGTDFPPLLRATDDPALSGWSSVTVRVPVDSADAVEESGQHEAQPQPAAASIERGASPDRVPSTAARFDSGTKPLETATAGPLDRKPDPDGFEPTGQAVSLTADGHGGYARFDPLPGPTLSPEEVARGLGTSPWWVREQARAGRVQHLRLGKGRIRFLPEHVRELVALCMVEVSESPAAVPLSSATNSLGALGGTRRSQRAHGLPDCSS